jgi:hypothetical protein
MKDEKNSQQLAVIHFDYEGNPVSFMTEGGIMVNATEMAKPFGDSKRPKEWLRLSQSKEFIQALLDLKNSEGGIPPSGGGTEVRILTSEELVQVKKGGANQGTWMHEDVAMEFARWLSPRFGIWCNDRIKELLTKGKTPLYPTTLNPENPFVKNYIKHINRNAYKFTKDPRINTSPDSVRAQLCGTEKDIYESLKIFCEKKRLPIRNVITAAIEEKIYREIHPKEFDRESLLQDIEMKQQDIDYLTRLLEQKKQSCMENFALQLEMKQQEADYLKLVLEAKNQTIAALQGAREGGES